MFCQHFSSIIHLQLPIRRFPVLRHLLGVLQRLGQKLRLFMSIFVHSNIFLHCSHFLLPNGMGTGAVARDQRTSQVISNLVALLSGWITSIIQLMIFVCSGILVCKPYVSLIAPRILETTLRIQIWVGRRLLCRSLWYFYFIYWSSNLEFYSSCP